MTEPRKPVAVWWLAPLTIAYFVAGKFGLSLAFVNASASAVWPPTGIAFAAFLLLGSRAWPAILVGAFLSVRREGILPTDGPQEIPLVTLPSLRGHANAPD